MKHQTNLTTATLQNVEYRKPLTVWGELQLILEKIFAASGVAGVGDSAEVYEIRQNRDC
jgi:hypothetical protein